MSESLARPRRRRLGIDDNILPLINVVFLLLAFFMIAGQLTRHGPVKVDPPASISDTPLREAKTDIHMTAEGAVFLNGKAMPGDSLAAALPRGEAGRRLRIFADRNTPARKVVRLMALLRLRGWTTLTITTQRGGR